MLFSHCRLIIITTVYFCPLTLILKVSLHTCLITEGKRSGIFRSGNWPRGNKYGEREGEGDIGLADTKVCQECTKVLRIGELLLSIHLGLCIHSKTIAQYGKERSEVGIDRETRKGIWGVERKIYKGTGASNAGSR